MGSESEDGWNPWRDLTFLPLAEHREIHIRPLWGKRKAGSLRGFVTARELRNGQGLHRACHSEESTGAQNCPGALCPVGGGTFRSSGRSRPLAGYAAPRPPHHDVTDTQHGLLHLPPQQHRLAKRLPPPSHQASDRTAPPMAATGAKHRGFSLRAPQTGPGSGDRHCGREAGEASFLLRAPAPLP